MLRIKQVIVEQNRLKPKLTGSKIWRVLLHHCFLDHTYRAQIHTVTSHNWYLYHSKIKTSPCPICQQLSDCLHTSHFWNNQSNKCEQWSSVIKIKGVYKLVVHSLLCSTILCHKSCGFEMWASMTIMKLEHLPRVCKCGSHMSQMFQH